MGEQIAENKAMHMTIQLFEDGEGRYRVKSLGEKWRLIKRMYEPLGDKFTFPKKWGIVEGTKRMLEWKIADWKRTKKISEDELDKLNELYTQISEWKGKV